MQLAHRRILLTVLLLALVVGQLTGNDILGLPDVSCQESRIVVSMQTLKPFGGRIFLKGNSHRSECVSDYKDRPFTPTSRDTRLQMAVDYSLCNTERIRQLDPGGVTYANTVIVQFHPNFITKGDKAYHLRCFYSERETTVSSELDVSMITADEVERDMVMPQCTYTVRKDSTNGPLVRHARVGDPVVHRWECSGNGDSFGMLIHSCFVEDDSGERTEIVDRRGCTLDEDLLPSLKYNDQADLAYSPTHVFKYPDNSFVYFRCQIRICAKVDHGCHGIVPPVCNFESTDNGTGALDVVNRNITKSRSRRAIDESIDVVTEEMIVLDESSGVGFDSTRMSQLLQTPLNFETADDDAKHSFMRKLCADEMWLHLLLTGFVLSFLTSVALIIHQCFNYHTMKPMES